MHSTLIHVNMIEMEGARQPTLLLPGIENFVALRAVDVYCSSLDGEPIRQDPVGFIAQIVRDCGSIAVVELQVNELYWELITGSFSNDRPMIAASTIDDFKVLVDARRTTLLDQCAGTQLAAACSSNDVPNLAHALFLDLTSIGAPDLLVASIQNWMIARANGDLSATFPSAFGSDYSNLDHAQLSAFRDAWNAAAETDALKVTARLWELYRMQLLSNAL